MKYLKTALILLLVSAYYPSLFAHSGGFTETGTDTGTEAPKVNSVTVMQADSALQPLYEKILADFNTKGQNAVASAVLETMNDPQYVESWNQLLNSTDVNIVSVEIHPNQKAAVEWMNKRFEKMGIPQLQLKGIANAQLRDPNQIDPKKIQLKKWLRYTAGPGIALASTVISLPDFETTKSIVDYGLLILPAAGVGFMTVLLEFQFAHPQINEKVWKPFWAGSGPIMGRVKNAAVNIAYRALLYQAAIIAAYLPVLFGHSPADYTPAAADVALVGAIVGGILDHIFGGQYQIDIAVEQEKGNIDVNKRLNLEADGVILNNGARVASAALPADNLRIEALNTSVPPSYLTTLVQVGFFAVRTFPQMWKSNVTPYFQNKKIKKEIKRLKLENEYANTGALEMFLCKDIGFDF